MANYIEFKSSNKYGYTDTELKKAIPSYAVAKKKVDELQKFLDKINATEATLVKKIEEVNSPQGQAESIEELLANVEKSFTVGVSVAQLEAQLSQVRAHKVNKVAEFLNELNPMYHNLNKQVSEFFVPYQEEYSDYRLLVKEPVIELLAQLNEMTGEVASCYYNSAEEVGLLFSHGYMTTTKDGVQLDSPNKSPNGTIVKDIYHTGIGLYDGL